MCGEGLWTVGGPGERCPVSQEAPQEDPVDAFPIPPAQCGNPALRPGPLPGGPPWSPQGERRQPGPAPGA